MSFGLFFAICLLISIAAIHVAMSLAARFGVLDRPGGHKQHDVSTPFVGGFGIFAALIFALYLAHWVIPEVSLHPLRAMVWGAGILFVTGLADDVWKLGFRIRFVIQALVAMSMILVGGVELQTLGEIVPGGRVDLGVLAVPFTIFATIGLINALNMIDGIDGLSGALSFISLGFVVVLASVVGNDLYVVLAIGLMGGVAGFLYFNLRYPSNPRARVFLGDNGSMLLGFLFAWQFIALSQGELRAMTPVTALWLFAVPLMDTVSVMLRRVWLGKSPFHADRNHFHHLFIRAGFRVRDTVALISIFQAMLAAFGIAGQILAVPESLMFGLFLLCFAVYFLVIARPWRVVPGLRHLNVLLGLPSVYSRGVFVGYFGKEASREVLGILVENIDSRPDYRLSLQRAPGKAEGSANLCALIEIGGSLDEVSVGAIQRFAAQIKARMNSVPGIQVRQLMQRSEDNDPRRNEARSRREGYLVRNVTDDRRAPHLPLDASILHKKSTA